MITVLSSSVLFSLWIAEMWAALTPLPRLRAGKVRLCLSSRNPPARPFLQTPSHVFVILRVVEQLPVLRSAHRAHRGDDARRHTLTALSWGYRGRELVYLACFQRSPRDLPPPHPCGPALWAFHLWACLRPIISAWAECVCLWAPHPSQGLYVCGPGLLIPHRATKTSSRKKSLFVF